MSTTSPKNSTPTELLIRTKLCRPRIAEESLRRQHLVEQLHASLASDLTLVCAPAGYGKTSLLVAWLQQVAHPVAWLSLDEGDSDLVVFLRYVAAALRTVAPTAATELWGLISSPTSFSSAYMARVLIGDLERLERKCVLVLDDYHAIRDDSPVHQLLSTLIKYKPASVHLVIASRDDPPLGLARLRAQNRLVELRARVLRFTLEESRHCLQQALQKEIAPPVIEALHERTEGWPAGVRLAALSAQQQTDFDAFARDFTGSSRFVMDYLTDEVLAHLPPATQRFLLQSSILKRCCAPLCAAVTETPLAQCQAILEWLETHNVFTAAVDRHGQWYRLHHLFRDLLAFRLHVEEAEAARIAGHERASRWFAERGLVEEALDHALAAGDHEAATALIEQHRRGLMNGEQFRTLEQWIARLPREWVESNPTLLLSMAWVAFFYYHEDEMAALLLRAERLLNGAAARKEPGDSALWGEAAALRGWYHYWRAEGERSLQSALQALEQLPPSHGYVRGVAVLYMGLAHQLRGRSGPAIQKLKEALSQAPTHATSFHLRVLMAQSFVYMLSAELQQVVEAAQNYLKLAQQHNQPISMGWARYMLGRVFYEWNKLEAAAHHFDAVIDLRHATSTIMLGHAHFGRALVYQAQNQPEQADRCIEALLDLNLADPTTSLLPQVAAFRTRLALLRGDVNAAMSWVRANPQTVAQSPLFFGEIGILIQMRALIAHGSTESLQRAQALLDDAEALTEATHNARRAPEILVLRALLHNAQGERATALDELARAVALAQPSGLQRLFLDFGEPLRDLLSCLLRQDQLAPALRTYLSTLLENFPTSAANEDSSAASTPPPSPLIEPLTTRELDVLTLLERRLSNGEIAQALVISPRTVKKHASNIYQKLGVSSRRQAVAKAQTLGILH